MIQSSINSILSKALVIQKLGEVVLQKQPEAKQEPQDTVKEELKPSPADIQKKKAEEELKAEQERIRQGREAAREQILMDTPWSKEKVQMEREEARSKILDLGKGV